MVTCIGVYNREVCVFISVIEVAKGVRINFRSCL